MTAAGDGNAVDDGKSAGTPVAEGWEAVIGLEVHCELRTATKLFCSCANSFGEEPNTNICPVCLGLPGSLPVLNRQAVELAMRIGAALNCTVEPSIFHRKNYFYPDMPKDYQITQYDEPVNVNGWLDLADRSRVGIQRAHLEEDTGKTVHVGETGRLHGADHSLVDYNRAGVPLVEIVSAPDIRSAEQARAYVRELRGVLVATGASDGRMEEGSLRVDANVSVRRAGDEDLGTRCEVKNMNSLRSLGRAVAHEAARQIALLEGGGEVRQETRHWNEAEGRTAGLRSKEEADDYRYFPEPDLVPLDPDLSWRKRVAASLPPLPAARRAALVEAIGSTDQEEQVEALVENGLDELVVGAVRAGADPRLAVNRASNEAASDPEKARSLDVGRFVEILELERSGSLSATQAKAVLLRVIAEREAPAEAVKALGFEAMADDELRSVVDSVVAGNPEEWGRYVNGDERTAQYLIGQVMKATKGKANGKTVAAMLAERKG